MNRFLAHFLVFLSLAPMTVLAQNTALDELVASELAWRHVPGAAIAIVHNGDVVFAKGYGIADLEEADSVTTETRFMIGSATKQFTAMAIMMLVEQGVVALDEKVATYLPRLPASYHRVTVRHLLSHTSGIERDFKKKSRAPFSSESLVGDDLFNALRKADLEFEPGAELSYSNTGYSLLGMLIEAVSGMTYEAFLRTHILDPLGMTSTLSMDADDVEVDHLATGYEWRAENYRSLPPALRFGGGSLVTTVEDMAKWDAALNTHTLVSDSTLNQIWTPHILNDQQVATLGQDNTGRHYKIGFGWFVSDDPTMFIVHHGGGLDGFSAQIDRYISEEVTIIVFCNKEEGGPSAGMARVIADHYFRTMRGASSGSKF